MIQMGKAAAKKNMTTTTEEDARQYLQVLDAKSKFLATTLGMGWRLALTVLIPLIAGIKIDERYNSSPSYTLAGFMIAVAGGAAVVWNSYKQVNAEQVEEDRLEKKLKTDKKEVNK